MRPLARVVTGRVSSVLCLIAVLLLTGAVFALIPKASGDTEPGSGLPADAESERVTRMLARFPDADRTAGLIVWTRGSDDARERLTDADQAAVAARVSALAAESVSPEAVRPRLSDDGTTMITIVPVERSSDADRTVERAQRLRELASTGLPDGARARLTGPLGFQADTVTAFSGADTRLLLITALVVAVLLIVTYRSPLLWLVPLAVVATADGLARFVVTWLGERTGLAVDASILGIMSVLVFGAGTNYALLLIARYREELLSEPDRRVAMRTAVTGAGPAVLASGGTVILSLLALLFAELAGNQALGVTCAVGIGLALFYALVVLPPALLVCGRGLFWPFVPRVGAGPSSERDTVWHRIGTAVSRCPGWFAAGAAALVGVLSLGLIGASVGLSQTEQLIGDPESVVAVGPVSEAFSPGLTSQTVILTPDGAVAEATGVAERAGATGVRPGGTAEGFTRLDVTLAGAARGPENERTITDLRAVFHAAPGDLGRTLVGGVDAIALDQAAASDRDQALLIPVILVVVLLVLILLLRSLLAPVLLVMTVVATFFASLGAGNLIFTRVLDMPAFDTRTILFGFLFLVALGVDYNIFLTTRAREERERHGTRAGMLRALTATGGVITSAGVVLAAVFVVLGVLPVVALAQIGTIVCVGVLLDTLVVRTILVPALAFLLGETFWWPSGRGAASPR